METGDQIVVADFEAGLGTLTRLAEGGVDMVIVVVEPTTKAIDVAKRALGMAARKELGSVHVVVNRVRDDDDLDRVRSELGDPDATGVPYDPAIARADREGRSPLDVAPDSPAVTVLAGLADVVLALRG